MKKQIYFISVLILLFLSNTCIPSDPDCEIAIDRIENIPNVNSVADFEPIQNQYQVGDTLGIIVNIPSQVEIGGFTYDMFGSTGDQGAALSFGRLPNLLGNQNFTVVKGESIDGVSRFNAIYNSDCDCYEFEGFVVLTETGTTFFDVFDVQMDLRDSNCDGFSLEQDILWINGSRTIEFEVIP
jgi:hypothetical protein